jgi:hypothetical protein
MSTFALVTGRRLWSSLAMPAGRSMLARQTLRSWTNSAIAKPSVSNKLYQSSLLLAAKQSAIFEISLLCCVSHYKHIGLCLMRNLFQTFRPLLITIVMGNLLKIGAFLLQFPIGFYAIFFFEAFYGIMQLAISFVFVCFFHNGMMMQRSRVLSRHWMRMMAQKLRM